MNKILLLLALISTTNFSFAKDSPFTLEAMDNIKNRMKDPSSTQFKNLREIKNTLNTPSLCGEVNSKNSYGGYVGFKPFSYSNRELTILDPTARSYEWYTNKAQYDQSGCSGQEAEMKIRKSIAADGYCKSVFQFYSDVVNNKITENKAMDIIKSSYEENNYKLIKQDFSELQVILRQGLKDIENNNKMKKEITKNNTAYMIDFIRQCKAAYQ